LTSIILNILEKRKYAYYPILVYTVVLVFTKPFFYFCFTIIQQSSPNTHDSTRQFTKGDTIAILAKPEKY
jgi:hypothetical protein